MKLNTLFFELIDNIRKMVQSEEFLDEFRVHNHFVRKGRISMQNMVTFLLFHSKLALDNKLDVFREMYPDLGFPDVSKQALSKARYGIKFELFKALFDTSARFYYEHVSDRKLWRDRYHLFAIDGSDQEVPSSKSTFAEFGKQCDKKNPKLFWSMALSSILYDVFEDIIVDAAIEKQFYSEREMSLRHLARLCDLGLNVNSIVIFDRGYYSKDIFLEWVNAGCKVLMRLKQPNSLCDLKGKDVITSLKYEDGTEIKCRVLQYKLNTGETEYLITNVMDKDITSEMFGELYFYRWKIESKYLEIKEQWKIEEFTGNGALSVKQDFYITMMHSNLASIIKHKADQIIAETTNPLNKYCYQARKTYIICKIQRHFVKWLVASFTQEEIDELIHNASKKRSQIQSNRSNERKRRTRARKHYNNRKSTF